MERVAKERSDIVIVTLTIAMLGVGMSLLFSASSSFSARTFQDPLFLVKRQLIWAALGAAAAFLVSLTPLDLFRRALPLILVATLFVSLLPFLPGIGTRVLGSRRWITIFGLSFQPSEMVKVTLILYLASYFARREESPQESLNALIPPFIVVFVFAGIILLQNDYSTALFIVAIGLSMLFIAKVRALHFFLVTIVTTILGFLLLFTREHRVQRLLAFFDLSTYRSGTAYQIVNARAALVSGGFWGRGLGRSAAKLGPLPMSQSDFIYTIIGEETGLLGALFIVLLFALLAWRGFQISFRAPDSFSSYVAFGATAAISLQALLNMAVAVGLVPTTGVTLPFFSAGGSSLFATLVMCGFLMNISRRSAHV
jgi:cell division protein FtsW